ncbi:hypothetical protein PMZ80_009991 [Knufia obscura]|uniref:Protein kinase domain-containing protein n=1 Tax=Knufia obscura TaxID=1635080 RepID=A0ABR0RB53_9EURO|nr:hypothetical protein PMZ80_009991 [Knufia obscura]
MATTTSAYAVEAGEINDDMSWVLAMRGCARFSITVRHKEIDTTSFGEQYFSIIEASRDKVHGFVRLTEPFRYNCEYCMPLLKERAPQMSFEGLTLEDLLHSPVYTFEIVKAEVPGGTRIVGGDKFSRSPAFHILPLKTVSLPLECSAIDRFAASQINLDDHDPSIGLQGRLPVSEGRYMYFKPREAGREKQFDRELHILNDIKRKGSANGGIKLPEVQGIVVSGEVEEECIGLLIDMIPASSFGTDLLSPGCWTRGELHKKGEQQVTAIVEVLHAHGVTWGDVNAGNVVIDEALDAWVIDFGGMNNPEFVDDDKAETMEGDWQGVRRSFQVWLPSRRAGLPP